MRRAVFSAAVFFLAFLAGLAINAGAQIASPTGYQYNVGYSVEVQVNGTTVFTAGVAGGVGPAGTQLIALEYPLTLQLVADNYSAVETPGSGQYYFPPVIETQTVTTTQTITKTITITGSDGRVYTTVVTIPSDSSQEEGGLEPRALGLGVFLAFLVIIVIARAARG